MTIFQVTSIIAQTLVWTLLDLGANLSLPLFFFLGGGHIFSLYKKYYLKKTFALKVELSFTVCVESNIIVIRYSSIKTNA